MTPLIGAESRWPRAGAPARQTQTSSGNCFLHRLCFKLAVSNGLAAYKLAKPVRYCADVQAPSRSLSVSARNGITGSSQIFSQFQFHLNRSFKRHRVQMFVKLWHQAHAIFSDD